MISLIDIKTTNILPDELLAHYFGFLQNCYKTNVHGKAKYGQNYYDFGEGAYIFSAKPNFERPESGKSGNALLIHPDFLLTYPLAKKIKQYGFFSYAANEALHYQIAKRKPS